MFLSNNLFFFIVFYNKSAIKQLKTNTNNLYQYLSQFIECNI